MTGLGPAQRHDWRGFEGSHELPRRAWLRNQAWPAEDGPAPGRGLGSVASLVRVQDIAEQPVADVAASLAR